MMQWASLVLHEDEVLLVSQEDMTCAFYLFRMPREWCPYFAVGLPITLEELEGNARSRDISRRLAGSVKPGTRGYLVLQVLPMGWKSAVGIMQAIHRKLLSSTLAGSNRLPTCSEIRKTIPLPISEEQRARKAWQVYLDNYASYLVVKMKEAEKMEGMASDWHLKARKTWEAWNIPSAADKSIANAFTAKELGCFVDGLASLGIDHSETNGCDRGGSVSYLRESASSNVACDRGRVLEFHLPVPQTCLVCVSGKLGSHCPLGS